MEMRAAVAWEPHTGLSVETATLPDPRPGDVLVRVVATGVCGSDAHVLDGDLPYYPYPIVPGHETAGIVEAVGADVTTVRPGDHVVLGWIPGCGRCPRCWNGEPRLCANLGFDGRLYDGDTRLAVDGRPVSTMAHIAGFAEYALVGERTCVKIREDAPLDEVCLIGCAVATGYGAVFADAQVAPGSTALVVGCGGVGLNVVQSLDLAAATTIVAADIHAEKLELARTLGATHTIDTSQVDLVEAVRELTAGRGVDYAFEVISTARTIEQAYAATRNGGTVTVVGVAPLGAEITLQGSPRKRLQGGSTPGTQWITTPLLVDLVMAGKLRLAELISRLRPLDEVNEAFADLRAGAVARTVLLPHGEPPR